MSTIIVSGSSPSTISVSIPQVNTIVVTPPEVRTISATLNVGSAGTPGQGVEAGGTTGQSLVKLNDNDYATTWADRLSAVVDDTSPELGGDLNTAGNAITFEDNLQASAGSLAFDNDELTLSYTNASGVTIEFGEKSVFYGKASEAIAKGDVVMFGGVQGNHLLLKKADQQAAGFIPEWVVGFAAQALNTNDFGYVVWFGKLDGLSGYNTSTYSDGDLLYLDPNTAGAVTLTEPTPAQGHSILLAAVLTASNGNAGRIIIRPTHKQDTDEVPEGSTNLYFTDARAQAAVDAFKDNDITFSDPTRAADLQSGGRLTFRDDSNQNILYLDEATRSVGVKTTSAPTATLDVGGDANISSNLTVGGSTVTLADSAILGVADTGRFTIGAISGSANLTVNATTEFTQITNFAAGIKINGGGGNNVTIDSPTLAGSYTITLPTDGGTSGYVLSTDGSGTTSWVAQSGGATQIDDLSDVDTTTVAPTNGQALIWDGSQWEPGTVASTDTNLGNTNLTLSAARTITRGGNSLSVVNSSTTDFQIDTTGNTRCVDLVANTITENNKTGLTSAGDYNVGARVLRNAYTFIALTGDAGNVVELGASAVSDGLATVAGGAYSGMLAVVTSSENANELLVGGLVRVSTNLTSASVGDIVYLSETAAGGVTTTAPSSSGEVVRIVGHVVKPANSTIYFNPSQDWTEL